MTDRSRYPDIQGRITIRHIIATDDKHFNRSSLVEIMNRDGLIEVVYSKRCTK